MSNGTLSAPKPLRRSDIRNSFCSGAQELDDWIKTSAWQNQRANNAVVYVTTQNETILGYYAIAASCYARDEAPEELKPHRRPTEIPCILLARLAVDQRAQGLGIGAGLLKDAIQRSYALSQQVGAAALLIHCRDKDARSFYLHYKIFLPSPANEMHLLLPMKQVGEILKKFQ